MTKDKMTDAEFHNKAKTMLTEQQKADEAKKPKTEDQMAVELAANTLTGDIRDFLLDRVKTLGKPLAAMTEDEQSDQIHAAKSAAETVVQRACEIIAAGGKKAMTGQLVKVAIKYKISVQVDFSKHDEQRHALIDAAGMTVSVVLADAKAFEGEKAPAEPTPQQGSLLDKAAKLKKGDDKVTPLK
jgi:hypothetical protein